MLASTPVRLLLTHHLSTSLPVARDTAKWNLSLLLVCGLVSYQFRSTSLRDDGVYCLLHSALPAPVVNISFSGDSIAGQGYSLQCSASVVAGLVVLPDLKIVFPNSTEISVMDSSSLDYMFSPLRTSDGGQYTCTATINIPRAGIMGLQNSAVETLVVVGKQCNDGHLLVHVCTILWNIQIHIYKYLFVYL